MGNDKFTIQKVLKIFGAEVTRHAIVKAENTGLIPSANRDEGKAHARRLWSIEDLPRIGERYGFMKKLPSPLVVSIFTTKGGVLKSTLALNLARMAALHNVKVCVVGLDMQCDITNALGFQVDLDDTDDLETTMSKLGSVYGLADFNSKKLTLDDILLLKSAKP